MPSEPSHVNLPAKALEEIRQLLHLIQNHELAHLFIQIQIRLSQDLPICVTLKIKIHRRTLRSDLQSKSCLSNLPRTEKHNGGLVLKGRNHGF
jgi:hypothetical protein